MDLTLKKLVKIFLKEKKFLIFFFSFSLLFYPIIFFFNKSTAKLIFKVDSMYNYTIPNSISSFLSETFINHLSSKIQENEFEKEGYKCSLINNDSSKKKIMHCSSINKKFEDFQKKIFTIYELHIENLSTAIKYAPSFSIEDFNKGLRDSANNVAYINFLKTEKKEKFYLKIEQNKQEYSFNFTYYILSFIMIMFINAFRIILKY